MDIEEKKVITSEEQEQKGDETKEEQKTPEMVPLATLLEAKKLAKEANERLAKLEAERKVKEDEDLKTQGEFQKLAEAKIAELTESQKTLSLLTAEVEGFRENVEVSEKQLLDSVTDPEEKEIIISVFNGKNLAEKFKLIPSLKKKFVASDNINDKDISGNSKPRTKTVELEEVQAQLKEAQAKGDVSKMLDLKQKLQFLQK